MVLYDLNERERSVLAVLIDHFIRTAEPVGSRVIATRYELGVSPATVRNTLADLEEQGLVQQPHTSAGRVPTDYGYRLYVDSLLKTEKLCSADKEHIRQLLTADFGAIEDILEQTSRVLAELTSQLGVTVSPKLEKAILKKINLIPVTDTKLMVIITVKSAIARTILVEVESAISESEIHETTELLNEKLSGLTLGEIRHTIRERLGDSSRGNPQLLKLFLEQNESILRESETGTLHTDGTTNIVVQKEFQDPAKLREFIAILEERRSLIDLLNTRSDTEGIEVTIGSESKIDGLEGIAAVTRTYHAGRIRGTVGIIGPTRMEYAKLISVVDYTARILTDILSR